MPAIGNAPPRSGRASDNTLLALARRAAARSGAALLGVVAGGVLGLACGARVELSAARVGDAVRLLAAFRLLRARCADATARGTRSDDDPARTRTTVVATEPALSRGGAIAKDLARCACWLGTFARLPVAPGAIGLAGARLISAAATGFHFRRASRALGRRDAVTDVDPQAPGTALTRLHADCAGGSACDLIGRARCAFARASALSAGSAASRTSLARSAACRDRASAARRTATLCDSAMSCGTARRSTAGTRLATHSARARGRQIDRRVLKRSAASRRPRVPLCPCREPAFGVERAPDHQGRGYRPRKQCR